MSGRKLAPAVPYTASYGLLESGACVLGKLGCMKPVSDLLLGDHLTEKSETVKWIDAAFPHKRKCRVKNHKLLVSIDTHEPTSTDILENNVLDNFYPQRPRNLDDVCLYDFIKWYEYSGTDTSGQRAYRKRTKAWLPNHKLYDPSNEQQRGDYFYSHTPLHPFQK